MFASFLFGFYGTRVERVNSNLVGALKAGGDHLGDGVHAVLRLLDDGVDFGEGGRLAHRRVLYRELQLLHVGRDLVHVIQQLFFQTTCRYLKTRLRIITVSIIHSLGID